MNVTELARKLKLPTKELLEILPKVGIDIGRRAIKVNDRIAQKILADWTKLYAQYQEMQKPEEIVQASATETQIKKIKIPYYITVKEFAAKLEVPLTKVLGQLMKNGVLSSMNEKIDSETAAIIAQDLGVEVETEESAPEEADTSALEKIKESADKSEYRERPPVIVVMGHVDHGKTKLLDTIRKTNVMGGESGGITQHIGAYQIKKNNRLITFIDTPGHEAFSTMRSRGARVADIAILIVAADDGVQPQTKESVKIINSAGLPMVVAINKIDKPEANIDKVKQELSTLNLIPEDWGGKTICVPISAKGGQGVNELIDTLLLISDLEKENLMAQPEGPAIGTVIESRIDKGEGPIATALIQSGMIKKGDLIVINENFYGKARMLKDFTGKAIEQAGPSTPVKIIGLKATATIGDILRTAKTLDKKNRLKHYQLRNQAASSYTVETANHDREEGMQSLNIILRTDVLGSLEAIISSLVKFEHPEVKIKIIAKGLGRITENDVALAEKNNALVLGFHAIPTQAAKNLAAEKKVEVFDYKIIYKLLDEVKSRLEKMLTPEIIRTDLGELKVLSVFRREKDGMIIGGRVTKGSAVLGSKASVIRSGTLLGSGMIDDLQSNKISVKDVGQGNECGIKFSGKTVMEAGDVLQFYKEEHRKKILETA